MDLFDRETKKIDKVRERPKKKRFTASFVFYSCFRARDNV